MITVSIVNGKRKLRKVSRGNLRKLIFGNRSCACDLSELKAFSSPTFNQHRMRLVSRQFIHLKHRVLHKAEVRKSLSLPQRLRLKLAQKATTFFQCFYAQQKTSLKQIKRTRFHDKFTRKLLFFDERNVLCFMSVTCD